MDRGKVTPTESEWLIMDAVWEIGDGVTSAEIIKRIHETDDMTVRTIRVLITLLIKKGLLTYTVDDHDSRVYHYYALRTKEECLEDKRRDFADSYFHGDKTLAAAAFLQGLVLTDEQIAELEAILEQSRENDGEKKPK
ncbi:MAG: BlaI/MecI/CopY family transcriptional regulator [Lachnospiraceae bacterium]|nr:BlaI/MecI/CopY family transcriptional regulator [Lachnospiraceae bacterium]